MLGVLCDRRTRRIRSIPDDTDNPLVEAVAMKALACLILAGCAISPDYEYEKTDRYDRALDEYNEKARACRNAGGYMQVRSHGRLRGPEPEDLKAARCVRH